MKTKAFFLFAIICTTSIALQAQRNTRIGYIDMDYILENVPEYQEASAQLDEKVNKWKSEIESKLVDVEQMKKQLENERVLLTKELIEERQEEIQFEEEQILEYQQKRFGPGGDLMIQRRQLVQPVQDQVFNSVQEIATNKKYDVVLTKEEAGVLYVADRLDMSDQVLRSITRSAKRKQINNRKEEDSFDRDEEKTVEQDKATLERQRAIEEKKSEREAQLEERAKERQAQKEERQKAFEERRKKLLEERQRRKDSIADARASKKQAKTTPESTETTAKGKDAINPKQAAIEARKRRKDSILGARKARRDSILAARKKRVKQPPVPPTGGDDDGGSN